MIGVMVAWLLVLLFGVFPASFLLYLTFVISKDDVRTLKGVKK